jgi:hypothetical protein
VLDPDVVLEADDTAVQMGTGRELIGASAVARTFLGKASAAQAALVDGVVSAVWAPGGKPRAVLGFQIEGDRIVGIHVGADPDRLGMLDVQIFTD